MKEIPILFSEPMVQAILEGRKTMTRRIIKTTRSGWDCQKMIFALSKIIRAIDTKISALIGFHAFFTGEEYGDHKLGAKCHYGQPGDILWVRETWCRPNLFDGFEKDFYFKAGFSPSDIKDKNASGLWKPSIHMPKVASRIWLQVEEIRVERLQDISEEDILNEGILIPTSEKNTPCFVLGFENSAFSFLPDGCLADGATPPTKKQILFAFWAELWCKINGRESWDANPWVWVVKFKVLSTTGKPESINPSVIQ